MSDSPERRPIYYGRDGNTVTLKMSDADYDLLLVLVGYATGRASRDGDQKLAESYLDFADRMNFMNPSWTPYTKTASKS